MARDVVLLLILLGLVAYVSVRYGLSKCPPCRKLKCSTPLDSGSRVPGPKDIVIIQTPGAPGGTHFPSPAPVEEAVVAGPQRTYISSNDTRWHEIGFVKGDGDRNIHRLFGHRKYARGERWEYFLRTKDGIDAPFNTPKDVELQNGDSITVPGFDGQFKAVIFPVRQLVYSPAL